MSVLRLYSSSSAAAAVAVAVSSASSSISFFPFNSRQCFTPLSQTIPHSEGTFIFTLHGRQTAAPNRPFLSARTTREYNTAQSVGTTNNFSPKHSSHNGPFSLLIDTLTGNFGHEIICNLFR